MSRPLLAPPLAALALLLPASAWAGGYALSEQDAAATGRGGTAVAARANLSGVHYNPASLAGLSGPAVAAGLALVAPAVTATEPGGSDTASTVGGPRFPPHLYAGWGQERFALGVGFNAPFGGGLTWPEAWRGRYELVEMSLQVLAGHLSAAYQINEKISAGVTLSLYGASLRLDKRIDFVDADGRALLGGSGTGIGAAFGVAVAPLPEVRLGLTGRIPRTLELEGRVHFSELPPAFSTLLQDQAITALMPLPGRLALGAEVAVPDLGLTALAEVEVTFWSVLQDFQADFQDQPNLSVKQPRNWSNAAAFRLGAEKDISGTTARAGFVFDGRASPADTLSPSSPDSHRLGFSAGAGRTVGPIRGDLAYQFIKFLGRQSEAPAFLADYSAHAHLVSLTLRYQ